MDFGKNWTVEQGTGVLPAGRGLLFGRTVLILKRLVARTPSGHRSLQILHFLMKKVLILTRLVARAPPTLPNFSKVQFCFLTSKKIGL